MTTIANVHNMLQANLTQEVTSPGDLVYAILPDDNFIGLRRVQAYGQVLPSWDLFHVAPEGIEVLGTFNQAKDAVDAASHRVKSLDG